MVNFDKCEARPPATGTSDLGIFSVMGRSRVASPPARMATGILSSEMLTR